MGQVLEPWVCLCSSSQPGFEIVPTHVHVAARCYIIDDAVAIHSVYLIYLIYEFIGSHTFTDGKTTQNY